MIQPARNRWSTSGRLILTNLSKKNLRLGTFATGNMVAMYFYQFPMRLVTQFVKAQLAFSRDMTFIFLPKLSMLAGTLRYMRTSIVVLSYAHKALLPTQTSMQVISACMTRHSDQVDTSDQVDQIKRCIEILGRWLLTVSSYYFFKL